MNIQCYEVSQDGNYQTYETPDSKGSYCKSGDVEELERELAAKAEELATKERIIDHITDTGIYPQSFQGRYEKRTEWMEGGSGRLRQAWHAVRPDPNPSVSCGDARREGPPAH